MKSFWLTTAWLLLLFTRTTAQCSNFYFLMRNAVVEMTVYDGKGKLTGVQTWKIKEINMDGSGTSSLVESVLVDGKEKRSPGAAAASAAAEACSGLTCG